MALDSKTENAVIALSSTANYATFETGVREVHLIATADCYVSFDETVATTSNGFLVKANTDVNPFIFTGGGPNKIWGVGTSGNLYVLAIR
ncbi:hypothetical protein M0R04_13520 [Candidatus Dojkabacteria bacterium]|nr:hypothetical protein [Candidatus Dojkabacteria bacterium]